MSLYYVITGETGQEYYRDIVAAHAQGLRGMRNCADFHALKGHDYAGHAVKSWHHDGTVHYAASSYVLGHGALRILSNPVYASRFAAHPFADLCTSQILQEHGVIVTLINK
jgi:hypothetical protein